MKEAALCLALAFSASAQIAPKGPDDASAALSQARAAAAADAQPLQGAERVTIPSMQFLRLMGYPNDFSREEIRDHLQRFVNVNYGVGFRHLGDVNDFFHGHFLYPPGRWDRPVAILYHTQENARQDPDGRYGYIDRQGRNWVQIIGAQGRIANAREYERRTYPEGAEWDRYRVRSSTVSPYTIQYAMLDDERLGIDRGYGIDLNRGPNKPSHRMFTFIRTDCASVPQVLDADDGVIEILLPAQGQNVRARVCLLLSDN